MAEMIRLFETGAYLVGGRELIPDGPDAGAALQKKCGHAVSKEEARKGTIAYSILKEHDLSDDFGQLRLRFDALAAHDVNGVSIIQTARASGMTEYPVPFTVTNCHNGLCAVGGTVNEDDHKFLYSAAVKYGGIYVPTNVSVIHQYNREMNCACGKMLLASDSHTRYGALGMMATGEGGGEVAKQLLGQTYDIARPEVVAVYLTGAPVPGVGPQDVALAIIGRVFGNGYVKNKVVEFVGDGVGALDAEFRIGVDVMTTETACWMSIWRTDETVKEFYEIHGRPEAYRRLDPAATAYYDGVVYVDLSEVRPMIAMPFHPSNVYTIEEVLQNPKDILYKVQTEGLRSFEDKTLPFDLVGKVRDGGVWVDQGIVAGCSGGTFGNLSAAAEILSGQSVGNGTFSMSVYPSSLPVQLGLMRSGALEKLISAGVAVKQCFCGPCFGAGDTPANGEFSIRHVTRNFPNREGSESESGQISSVALMDARSIAATARNGGRLTAATELDGIDYTRPRYYFDKGVYDKRVYNGVGKPQKDFPLRFGPGIRDWPEMPAMTEHLLLRIASFLTDPVTTTDELSPSGPVCSYRSNPEKIASFALYHRDPAYVGKARETQELERARERGEDPCGGNEPLQSVYRAVRTIEGFEGADPREIAIGSAIFANKPGDGSAREQAASGQRVLGGWANFAHEYATKRYRSNLINWGILPFLLEGEPPFERDDYVFIPHLREAVLRGDVKIDAYAVRPGENSVRRFTVSTGPLTRDERAILCSGCLINFYRVASDAE